MRAMSRFFTILPDTSSAIPLMCQYNTNRVKTADKALKGYNDTVGVWLYAQKGKGVLDTP